MSTVLRLIALGLLVLLPLQALAETAPTPVPPPAQPTPAPPTPPAKPTPNANDLCQGREGCRMLWSQEAGHDANGHALVVSEVVFAQKDKIPSCHRPQDSRFGEYLDHVAQEIWLSTFGGLITENKKLLEYCNDGYGAADLGEDRIDVEDNKLIRRQFGGDNARWVIGKRFQLAPFALSASSVCLTHTQLGGGSFQAIDFATGVAQGRFTPRARDTHAAPANFMNCEETDPDKVKGKYKSLPIKQIYSFAGIALDQVKELGSCATRLVADEAAHQGFVIFGQRDNSKAELRLLRINDDVLWVDVQELGRSFKASEHWQNDDRLEIWWMDEDVLEKGREESGSAAPTLADKRRSLRQFVVRLADLQVFAGYGYAGHKLKLPEVERRDSEVGLRLAIHWPPEQFPSSEGLTVSLAHGDGAATQVIYSTSTLHSPDPLSLGSIMNMQENNPLTDVGCAISKKEVLDVVAPKAEK